MVARKIEDKNSIYSTDVAKASSELSDLRSCRRSVESDSPLTCSRLYEKKHEKVMCIRAVVRMLDKSNK